jgi:hypothetical protein
MNGANRGADDMPPSPSRAPAKAPLGYAMAYRVLEIR